MGAQKCIECGRWSDYGDRCTGCSDMFQCPKGFVGKRTGKLVRCVYDSGHDGPCDYRRQED